MLFLTCIPQGKTSKMAITICLMYMTIIYLAYVVCFHSIGKKASLYSNLSILSIYVFNNEIKSLHNCFFTTQLPQIERNCFLQVKSNFVEKEICHLDCKSKKILFLEYMKLSK